MSAAVAPEPRTRQDVPSAEPPVFGALPPEGEEGAWLLAPLWRAPHWWRRAMLACLALTALMVGTMAYSVIGGPGVWGNNIPAAWAYPIVIFVWWIGIGHAGVFVSAALLFTNSRSRVALHRLAEIMAIVALAVSGIFPILHLGRQWYFYWLLPYPSTTALWPQFRSSLSWDVVTVTAHLLVAAVFLWLGVLPDLALARDRAPTRRRRLFYGVLALGWRGASSQWVRHRRAYALVAASSAVLVVSSESTVSFDFAIAQLPGWHSTFLPVYFLASALYSGAAMLALLVVLARRGLGLGAVLTERHLDRLSLLLLACGLLFGYGLVVESFTAWYSAGELGRATLDPVARADRSSGWALWALSLLTVLAPQPLWRRAWRRSARVVVLCSVVALVAIFAERCILVIATLNRGFIPSSWATYLPTWVDWGILVGSVGFFGLLVLVLARLVPVVAVDEVRQLRHELPRGGR